MRQQATARTRPMAMPLRCVFLATACLFVHGWAAPGRAAEEAKNQRHEASAPLPAVAVLRDVSQLPEPVRRMRAAIIEAAAGGDIEALREPVEMNEIPPAVGDEPGADAIAQLRALSGDGEGREMLAVLIELFRTGFVRTGAQTGHTIYVWPYFAELPLDRLTPAQEVELLTLVPPARLKAMRERGRYDYYRLGIGQDGTWHFFLAGEEGGSRAK